MKARARLEGPVIQRSDLPYDNPVAAAPPVLVTAGFTKEGRLLDEKSVHDTLEVSDFLVAPARVGLELGQTINLGNYESLRIAVSLSVPCYTEEVAEAYKFAAQFITDRIQSERQGAVEWARKRSAENLF